MSVISKMTFDNGSTKNLISSTFYGKCDTAAATAAKTVTIGGWDESVKDNVSGATVHIYFTNGNTANNPTLNIDGGGAHPIYLEDDVKAAAFPAGIYSFTLVLFTVSGQETWCWLMSAKAISAASVPWSGVTNPPATYTPSSHTHGNISNAGAITSTVTIASGDKLIVADSSDSNKIKSATATFGSSTNTYLRNDGEWATPTVSWSEVSGKPSEFTPSSHTHTWSSITNPPTSYTPSSHSHGNIDDGGTISATATATNSDSLIMSDSSASGALVKGPTFGTSTSTYLRNDGTWATPSVSGYIPTSEKGAASGVATLDTNSKVPIVQSNYLYGKCTTAGGTAAKTVTIAGYDETTIANMEGVTVFVAFKNINTASSPTLNVNSAGAHPIVTGTYDDPVAIGKFTNGLHAFTLVKALDNSYYWWINEGRDTVPEAPTSAGTYLLTINSSGNATWSSYTPPAAATVGTVTIGASGWSGSGPYSHSVTISGSTANSKIDLQPDSTVLAQMTTDGTTALYIENDNGTLTAWAMGAAPTATLAIQYTKTEVS